MQINYLITMEQALNYLHTQGLDVSTNRNYENNIKHWCKAAHDKICQYLGYEILTTVYTDELLSGNGTHFLYLINRPITALTTIKYDDVAQTIGDFSIYQECAIYYKDGFFTTGINNWNISYTAGYTQATMPHDIRNCAMQLVALFAGQPAYMGKSSISDGAGGSETVDPDTEDKVLRSIDSYRSFHIG